MPSQKVGKLRILPKMAPRSRHRRPPLRGGEACANAQRGRAQTQRLNTQASSAQRHKQGLDDVGHFACYSCLEEQQARLEKAVLEYVF